MILTPKLRGPAANTRWGKKKKDIKTNGGVTRKKESDPRTKTTLQIS